jgi:hypothetical protein
MLQRLVLYSTLGVLANALGHTWDSWQFWCLLGLFWAADQLARTEGYQQGMAFVATLPPAQLDHIRKELERLGLIDKD